MQVQSETQSVTAQTSSTSETSGGTAVETGEKSMVSLVVDALDTNKAEDINTIDLSGKSSMADHMVIANGRSQRQVAALTDYVLRALKGAGVKDILVQGLEQADWVLIDAGDVIVHLFRPEVREFYNLDKMWGASIEQGNTIN